jgi:amidophosphoribosyltransferase
MPSRHELVAHNRTTESIACAIGADLVIFQTLPDLVESVRRFNPAIETFDCSVFTGEYVTGGVSEEYLLGLERARADHIKGASAGNAEDAYGMRVADGKGCSGQGSIDGVSMKSNGRRTGEEVVGSSGPLNGADDTVGLHNSWKVY